MWAVWVSLVTVWCAVEATPFNETCNYYYNRLNGRVHPMEGYSNDLIAKSNDTPWRNVARFPIGVEKDVTCEYVAAYPQQSNGSLIFFQTGQDNQATVTIKTVADQDRTHPPGSFLLSENGYDPSQVNTIPLVVLLADKDKGLAVVWACFRPVDGSAGSEQGLWVLSADDEYTSEEKNRVTDVLNKNGLSVQSLQETSFANCSL